MLAASAGASPCISSVHAVMLLLLQSQFASSNRKALTSQRTLAVPNWHLLKVHFIHSIFLSHLVYIFGYLLSFFPFLFRGVMEDRDSVNMFQ